MDPQRPNKILDEWNSVTASVSPPAGRPRGIVVRSRLAGPGLVGGGLLIAGLLVAVVWLGRPGPDGGVGDVPSAQPSASQSAAVVDPPATPVAPSASPTVQPSATPKVESTPTPSPAPTLGPCKAANLTARITSWEGAAGNRIAEVVLTNKGSELCIIGATAKPQLVDSKGSILINGSNPTTSSERKFQPNTTFKTLVDVANYCGPDPIGFVTVAFVDDGAGRIVASPLTPTDATIPPCNSAPGTPGDIQMHPWAP